MSGRLDRLWTLTLLAERSRSIPFHKPDRQSNLTGLAFAALTPPAALFEVILAVLTPLGHDFWVQVAPTWALGPSPTLQKPVFPLGFSYISRSSDFCHKVAQNTSK